MFILPVLNTSKCSPFMLVQWGSPDTVAGVSAPLGAELDEPATDDETGGIPPVNAAVGAGVGEGVGGV